MKLWTLLLMLVAGWVPSAFGQAGVVSRMGFGARGIALGNALGADITPGISPYYNPALTPFTGSQQVEGAVGSLTEGRELQFLQIAAALPPRAGLSLSVIRAAVTNIDGRDASGFHTGMLSTEEFAFGANFGVRVSSKVSLGAGLQIFRNALAPSIPAALSVGVDLGLLVRFSDRLAMGFVADDLLSRYTYDTSQLYGSGGRTNTDYFPTRLRLASRYQIDSSTTLFAEGELRVSTREVRTTQPIVLDGVPREGRNTTRYSVGQQRARFGVQQQVHESFRLYGGMDHIGADGLLSGAQPSVGVEFTRPLDPLVLNLSLATVLQPYGQGLMHFLGVRVLL